MTVKTSLFNKGIYKSTVRRFLWGSILYFIALFLTTSLPILMTEYGTATILNGYLIFPMVLATAAPTVVGIMVYRFIHSKRASVFTHSLPTSREANYISTVLASLTLMVMPIVLNTAILVLLTVMVPGADYGVVECMKWMGNTVFAVFIMFSCTSFVASLTGNSFAMVVLNVLIHTALLIVAECVSFVAEEFIYGFESRGGLIRAIEEGNFPARVFFNAFEDGITLADYIIPLIAAVVFYVLALVLYKKRHNETADDIAGFKCLNHILKHFLTMLVALVTFSGFSQNSGYEPMMTWVTVLVLGGVTYFGIEMLLKKTFRVWGSYKGFVVCSVVFVVFIILITKTSFFGYETRVPDADKVESISVCTAYDCLGNTLESEYSGIYDHFENCDIYFDNKEIIEKGIDIHKARIAERDIRQDNLYNLVEIRYKLKGGKTLSRRYYMYDDELYDVMDSLYVHEEYKKAHELFLRDDITITRAYVYSETTLSIHPIEEFVACMKKDIEELSYSEIKATSYSFGMDVEYKLGNKDKKTTPMQKWMQVSRNYKNTLKWLEDNEYQVKFN